MKIGVDLGPESTDESDGISLILEGVLQALVANHPEQEIVLFCTSATADRVHLTAPKVEKVILPAEQYEPKLNEQFATRRIDVLFRTSPPDVPSVVPLSRQVVLITDMRHEFYWETFPLEEFARRSAAAKQVMQGAGALAALSEYSRESIRALAAPRQPDVFVLSPVFSADLTRQAESRLTEEERGSIPQADFFFYPANIEPHKNHRRLLKAFDRFLGQASGKVELVLTGRPDGWKELAADFSHLPVRHLGDVRPGLLQELYKRARALVYFSLYEEFALPLLEALRSGVPVVCGNATCLPEIAGAAALTCDPTDLNAMCAALVKVASDEVVRQQIIASGRDRLAVYSGNKSATTLLEACIRVAKASAAPAPKPSLILRGARAVRRRVRGLCRRALSPFERFRQPRYGILHQYKPRGLVLPSRYSKESIPRDAPVISIVTPSYNQAVFLERTMHSVLDQKYPRLQYIVQDGGSTDGSAQLIEQFGDQLTHWESAPDRGQASAINLGFRHATGAILAYLNSDDVLLPGSLAYVARYFTDHPEVDVIYGHRIVIDSNDGETARWIMPPHDDEILSWEDCVPQETMFWRREIWERVGARLDESFQFAMDWDLILRFREAGARFARVPRFLGAFRTQPDQKTLARLDLYYPESRRLLQRCHGRLVGIQEILRARVSYTRRQVFYHYLYSAGLHRC